MDCFSSPTANSVRTSRWPAPVKNSRASVDDLPLLGAGVLRLVDEDVVDAAIEFEQHHAADCASFKSDTALAIRSS
jgi:hypothetical protein